MSDETKHSGEEKAQQMLLALYQKVTGKEAELSEIFTLDHCAREIEQRYDIAVDAVEQAHQVQQTETRVILKLFEKLQSQELNGDRAEILKDCLEKGVLQCRRILEETPLKLGLPGEDEEDPSAQLIDVIISAVTDPSLYDEFQGERTLSEWQQDAVLEALNQTGFDLVGEYDAFVDQDVETLKAELNIANALIEKLYQRSYESLG